MIKDKAYCDLTFEKPCSLWIVSSHPKSLESADCLEYIRFYRITLYSQVCFALHWRVQHIMELLFCMYCMPHETYICLIQFILPSYESSMNEEDKPLRTLMWNKLVLLKGLLHTSIIFWKCEWFRTRFHQHRRKLISKPIKIL